MQRIGQTHVTFYVSCFQILSAFADLWQKHT